MNGLAIDGGRPVRDTPLPRWPQFGHDEIAAARDVLASGRVNYWTGEHGRGFEREFGDMTDAHALAVSNGTVALELTLRALGIGAGDDVIVPAVTFIATASAVAAQGARPVVADVDLRSQCLTVETVERALTTRTRAIIVVHFAGHPAEIAPFADFARERGLLLVEDCAQAHGASYLGRSVGGFGDAGTWSFCQDKIITTGGEGGAITTHDPLLWRRCWEFKDHGKNYPAMCEPRPPGGQHWVHDSFGTNARMTELQAAIGREQLRKLPYWVKQRRANAELLLAALRNHRALRLEHPPAHVEHAYYRFYAHLRPEYLAPGWNRGRVVAAINAEGIPCGHGGCAEIYREPAFASVPDSPTALPVAATLGRTSVVLPVQPHLGENEMYETASAVVKVLAEATR